MRAISAITNPAAIDVFTDFNLVATNLTNGQISGYSNQQADLLNVGIRQFGETETLVSGVVDAGVGEKYTLIPHQTGAASWAIIALPDNIDAPAANQFKVRLTHVDRFTGLVDLYFVDEGADLTLETPVATGIGFQSDTGYFSLPGGVQKEFVLTLAGKKTVVGNSIVLTPVAGSVRTLLLLDNGTPALNIYTD